MRDIHWIQHSVPGSSAVRANITASDCTMVIFAAMVRWASYPLFGRRTRMSLHSEHCHTRRVTAVDYARYVHRSRADVHQTPARASDPDRDVVRGIRDRTYRRQQKRVTMNNTDAPSDLQHAGWSKRHDDDGRSAYSDDQPAAQPPNPGPMTPSLKTLQPSDADMGEPGDNEDERLDEALQESMTTSDPVSIKIA